MDARSLAAFATRTGTTAGVAQAIGEVLSEHGAQVDVLPAQEVRDVTPYQAVVLGSAIQGQEWLPDALEFAQVHQAALRKAPCAVFLVCMTLTIGEGKYRSEVANWLQPVRGLIRPVSEGLFTGAMDISKVPGVGNRIKFRLSVAFGVWKEGDHRDWDAIRAWAESLAPLLMK
jgi:menaquinone-dependent protoporphyrinogen oxidase